MIICSVAFNTAAQQKLLVYYNVFQEQHSFEILQELARFLPKRKLPAEKYKNAVEYVDWDIII